jgi:hypothetical protein
MPEEKAATPEPERLKPMGVEVAMRFRSDLRSPCSHLNAT